MQKERQHRFYFPASFLSFESAMRPDRNANYAVGFVVERPCMVAGKNTTVVDKQTSTLSSLMREIFAVSELNITNVNEWCLPAAGKRCIEKRSKYHWVFISNEILNHELSIIEPRQNFRSKQKICQKIYLFGFAC